MSEDKLVWIVMIIFIIIIMNFMSAYQMKITVKGHIFKLDRDIREIDAWLKKVKEGIVKTFSKYGRKKEDIIYAEIDALMNFFTIAPSRDEPIGVISKLEHILDTSERRLKDKVVSLAPKATSEEKANLELCVEAAIAMSSMYKQLLHLLTIIKKTNNVSLAVILQMQMPLLKQVIKSCADATEIFAKGAPIGDGFGPLVALNIVDKKGKYFEPVKDTVYTVFKYKGRNVFVAKAKGPGGRVGKPGELAKYILNKHKIKRIIVVDAALKLECEKSGEIAEGVGTAIGGPPVDKYKIETISTEKNVPVDAIVVKQSLSEALGPMTLAIFKTAEVAAEKVMRMIVQKTKPKDNVLVLGIGNTIGIGQTKPIAQKTFPLSIGSEKDIESPILQGIA